MFPVWIIAVFILPLVTLYSTRLLKILRLLVFFGLGAKLRSSKSLLSLISSFLAYSYSWRCVICSYYFSILFIFEISMSAKFFCLLIRYSFKLLFMEAPFIRFNFYLIRGSLTPFFPLAYFICTDGLLRKWNFNNNYGNSNILNTLPCKLHALSCLKSKRYPLRCGEFLIIR